MAEGVQKTCKYCDGEIDWQRIAGGWYLVDKEDRRVHRCQQYQKFKEEEAARKELEAEENKRLKDRHREESGYL